MRFLGFFTVLIFDCFRINSQAQNFGGGLIAGVKISQVVYDMLGGFNKISFLFGGYTNLSVKENMSLKYEITYIEKEVETKYVQKQIMLIMKKIEISLSYIEMPLTINLQQKENLELNLGIMSAFNISGF